MKKLITALALSIALSTPVWAATQTVTLLVTGMTCASCPITIKKALNKVEGVKKIEINLEEKEALSPSMTPRQRSRRWLKPPRTRAIRPPFIRRRCDGRETR